MVLHMSMQDLQDRLTALSCTLRMENFPPSRNATLSDVIDLGYNAPGVQLGAVLNTLGGLGGEFCYIYV